MTTLRGLPPTLDGSLRMTITGHPGWIPDHYPLDALDVFTVPDVKWLDQMWALTERPLRTIDLEPDAPPFVVFWR